MFLELVAHVGKQLELFSLNYARFWKFLVNLRQSRHTPIWDSNRDANELRTSRGVRNTLDRFFRVRMIAIPSNPLTHGPKL